MFTGVIKMKLYASVFRQYNINIVKQTGKNVTFIFEDYEGLIAFETMLNNQSPAPLSSEVKS